LRFQLPNVARIKLPPSFDVTKRAACARLSLHALPAAFIVGLPIGDVEAFRPALAPALARGGDRIGASPSKISTMRWYASASAGTGGYRWRALYCPAPWAARL
jgi:hypothetical protein